MSENQSGAVFSVSASSVINAPPDHVWKILTDFKSYREWNPFVRAQNLVDSDRNPLPDDALTTGLFLNISEVHLPPTMGKPTLFQKAWAFERITEADAVNHRLAWEFWGPVPKWLLYAERWQILTAEGDGQTKYHTFEEFTGVLAHVVKLIQRKKLGKGFVAMAETLKARAEETYQRPA
ncbi:hypothetical protein FA15DRAFT_669085 [Coprinopsis marcescibilis]|uniref:Coenzyme Q-binding protein COQ10 START domain-containing protein n=1 Tax=Coprinopsis marcescibilis TaxID=230819 RepID=A0A5C3KWR0_COPMA|nr:hypothetical protein FA15DRAFT_669085 [Coprinopsis marcescibilis]